MVEMTITAAAAAGTDALLRSTVASLEKSIELLRQNTAMWHIA